MNALKIYTTQELGALATRLARKRDLLEDLHRDRDGSWDSVRNHTQWKRICKELASVDAELETRPEAN